MISVQAYSESILLTFWQNEHSEYISFYFDRYKYSHIACQITKFV